MNKLRINPPKEEKRSYEQLKLDYEAEKELSNQLRNSSNKDRLKLYNILYDKYYSRFTGRKHSLEARKISARKQMMFCKRFLRPDTLFLEVGAGDCSFSCEVSRYVNIVYAIEVSEIIIKNHDLPQNSKVIIYDGCQIPFKSKSINIAYSNQLMEHLHPQDALSQLTEIFRSLSVGGQYICITPNRLSGPHDISKYFDDTARGFHLKEYSVRELAMLFRKVGFSKILVYVGGNGIYVRLPIAIIVWIENFLGNLLPEIRLHIVNLKLFKALLGIRMVAKK